MYVHTHHRCAHISIAWFTVKRLVFKMSARCLLVIAAVFPIFVAATPYLECDSAHGTVFDVRVSNCSAEGPCILTRNQNVSIEVDFAPNVNISSLTDKIKGIIIGIPIPFPTSQPDACTGKGLTCPLLQGRNYTYRNVMFVRDTYPRIRLIVEWAVVDADNTPVFCIKIPALIQ
ncbi:NPC intracellular cholesterol transporter 2 homolog a [Octopus bimaculoides]|nr:NPC intracellular cholesterol transporter 2 homolog a [Octopus bimaculoides]|eukprot:XP_014790764.1 PREDICTED: protein NPC2 homolog [Octopus bimaculoides]